MKEQTFGDTLRRERDHGLSPFQSYSERKQRDERGHAFVVEIGVPFEQSSYEGIKEALLIAAKDESAFHLMLRYPYLDDPNRVDLSLSIEKLLRYLKEDGFEPSFCQGTIEKNVAEITLSLFSRSDFEASASYRKSA